MRPFAAVLLSSFLLTTTSPSAVLAQPGTVSASAPVVPRQLQEILRNAVMAPSSAAKGAASSSQFTPSGEKLTFLTNAAATATLSDGQKKAFRLYAEQTLTMVEEAYTNYGFPRNDLGAAFGGLLETCYQMDRDTFKIGNDTEAEKQKTIAAVRQMQRAIGGSPAFASLSDRSKQTAYEYATFLIGHLALQWQQAGTDATKKEAVQRLARQQLEALFKLNPSAITRTASGEFVGEGITKTSEKAVAGSKAAGSPAVRGVSTGTVKTAAVSKGPLPAASLGGARIFVKYRLSYYPSFTTSFDHLILFPDGTAFDDLPSKPMPQFSKGVLTSMVKPIYVGTWKQSGSKIVLSFPANTREPQRVLLKHPNGWYDGKELPKKSTSYDIYYPVVAPPRQHLIGAWKSSSLTTMGAMGGGTAMVAAGSNSNRVFRADGTFSGGKKSFASATTANMGDAFKSGGDVTTNSNSSKSAAGRWRLDGPLLTMEQNGQRAVYIAFIMPHWSNDPKSQSDMMIDGDLWQHPGKD